jgi:disease resistance protein RPM1
MHSSIISFGWLSLEIGLYSFTYYRYIRGELEMMQSFLMAADAQKNDNTVVRTWIRQVKDLAYQIEDCLVEFSIHLENRNLCYRLWTWNTRLRIASNIRDIKAKVQEVSKRNMRYNLIKPHNVSSDITSRYVDLTTQMAALVVEEAELVGQSEPKDELIKLIVENDIESRNIIIMENEIESRSITELENNIKHKKVIWIVGMGGLGKTTLTKKVFDDKKIRAHFKYTAWVTVSQTFNLRNILINILIQISGEKYQEQDLIKKNEDDLLSYVRSELRGKKSLVVLDDLWSIQAWGTIENVFSDGGDSCVVITTRNKNVAKHCSWKVQRIYDLKPLSDEDALVLLLRKINKNSDFLNLDKNKKLKEVINKIIKKCEGLPLALVTIGGLLASRFEEDWEKVLVCLGSELETNPSAVPVKRILDLSYNDLPYHLKPCLLYLSIFPEDFEIKRGTLVRRWMAEGYVRGRRDMTPEEVGKEYFYELINRNLILPSKVGDDGRIKRCKVHDIMRELIVAKSIDENLIFIAGDSHNKEENMNFRHLIVPSDSKEVRGINQPNVRSVSIFDGPIPELLFSPYSKSKLLRVLEMSSSVQYGLYEPTDDDTYTQFIKRMQQFVHLKYISIPKIETGYFWKFPNFRNLQTLEIKYVHSISKINIAKLQQLRHLLCDRLYSEYSLLPTKYTFLNSCTSLIYFDFNLIY